ncbi:MAG: SPOR domain-containing protein [Treponema sp.]|nr:SPOR domain-containing protein [Treponema sp.]
MRKSCIILYTFIIFYFLLSCNTFALTASEVVENSSSKESALESIDYIRSVISQVKVPSERRSLFAFLGALQEQLGLYSDACSSYVNAASIAAGDAAGMQKISSEQLILNAVRSSLSAGDYESADIYLSSAVRNSTDDKINAYINLYEQWCILCKAQDVSDINEPISKLETYTTLSSMKIVWPSIYLTLWYVTGKDYYGKELSKLYPKSPEAAIVNGDIYLLPAPFWYFIPKNGTAQIINEYAHSEKSKKDSVEVIEQLGLFSKWSNASNLVTKLAAAGFEAYIKSDVRDNGKTYYLVLVDDDKNYSVGKRLKSSGFDCYPIKNK